MRKRRGGNTAPGDAVTSGPCFHWHCGSCSPSPRHGGGSPPSRGLGAGPVRQRQGLHPSRDAGRCAPPASPQHGATQPCAACEEGNNTHGGLYHVKTDYVLIRPC